MRIKADRTNQILELLAKAQKIEVAQLSQHLNVSQVTVRKDPDEPEQRGIVSRIHGYAVLRSTDGLGTRIAYHYGRKRKIAKKAGEMVSDGETVMIENGSCCALLADAMTQSHTDLTIITNSAFIASYIRGKASFQIVLLGGIFQPGSQAVVGPMVRHGGAELFLSASSSSERMVTPSRRASPAGISSARRPSATWRRRQSPSSCWRRAKSSPCAARSR